MRTEEEINAIAKQFLDERDFINSDRHPSRQVTPMELIYRVGVQPVGISSVPQLNNLSTDDQFRIIDILKEAYTKED